MLTLCVSVQVEQCNIQECPCRCKPSVKSESAELCLLRMPLRLLLFVVSLCENLTTAEWSDLVKVDGPSDRRK